jgi:3-deoxy-D-arabino-heptulosonate 7-phosphate (DAHP) synthase class II
MQNLDLPNLKLSIMVKNNFNLEKYESYRGDIINSFDSSDRVANPSRMLEAYYKSATTMYYLK